jgi:hypothetical protein
MLVRRTTSSRVARLTTAISTYGSFEPTSVLERS